MSKTLHLRNLHSLTVAEYVAQLGDSAADRLHVGVSGYESRCIATAKEFQLAPRRSEEVSWCVLGFEEMKEVLKRSENDQFYRNLGLEIKDFSRDDGNGVQDRVLSFIKTAQRRRPLDIHIDYSCMPRKWYCGLPKPIEESLRPGDRVFFWYAGGNYRADEYPTAGVSDFHVFAGQASLDPQTRTHIFGLGFDRVRSSAILSVLDPQYLIAFYADPGVTPEYVNRVKKDNDEIIAQSKLIFTVPLHDYTTSFSKLCSLVTQFRAVGDVIIVPDGPKPLILASSMLPLFIGETGVVAFHVSRRRTEAKIPIDVTATGDFWGFGYSGPLKSSQQ